MSRVRMKAKIGLRKPNFRGDRQKWVEVGAAFVMPSGQINLVLDTLPVMQSEWDGTIVLFPPDADEEDEE